MANDSAAAPAHAAGGSRRPGATEAGGSRHEGATEAGGSRREGATDAGGSRRPGATEAGGSRREGATVEGFRQHRYTAPPTATTILLVRHGESAPAHADRPFDLVDGHGDPPLHEHGHAQAQRLAARLARERVDAIYVTTLRRTHETAAPLAAALGLTPTVEPDLREVHLGEWEGGMLRVHAAAGHPLFRRIFEEERWDVIPGAESPHALAERTLGAIHRIAAAHPGSRVVAVTHGGVIGQLLCAATGARGFAFSGADNASISEIVLEERDLGNGETRERIVVRRFNDTAHLDD